MRLWIAAIFFLFSLALIPQVFAFEICPLPPVPGSPNEAEEQRLYDECVARVEKGGQEEAAQTPQPKNTQQPTIKAQPSPTETTQTSFKTLIVGIDIKEGQTVKAEKGQNLTIIFQDGSKVDVKEGGTFTLDVLTEKEVTLKDLKGKLHLFVKGLVGKNYKAKTSSLVAGVKGTEFLVYTNENGTDEVFVLAGTVNVSDKNEKNTIAVEKGYKIAVAMNGKPGQSVAFDPGSIERWFDNVSQPSATKSPQTASPSPKAWIIVGSILLVILAAAFFLARRFFHF